jgi:hypothetical protein
MIATVTAAGFRVKTGRAIVIVLDDEQRFVARREIALVDPRVPETAEPHHAVMHLPWRDAQLAVKPFEEAIVRVADDELRKLVDEFGIDCVGVAGAPDRDPGKVGNEHIRAHSAEGMLFRQAVEAAARHAGLPCITISDRETPPALKELGSKAGRPWRADERLAAHAALRSTA